MKLRSGDPVKVIAGKDSGTESRIARVFPEENKIIVEGVATAKRAQCATGATMQGVEMGAYVQLGAAAVPTSSSSSGAR